MKKFYVDTSVWLDFALGRSDGVRPLGELAFQFFKKCIRERWLVLYSDVTIVELCKCIKPLEVEEKCFRVMLDANLLSKASLSKEEPAEAENISKRYKVPFADALHAVIARDNSATIVSRDAHFDRLSDIVSVVFPEDT